MRPVQPVWNCFFKLFLVVNYEQDKDWKLELRLVNRQVPKIYIEETRLVTRLFFIVFLNVAIPMGWISSILFL